MNEDGFSVRRGLTEDGLIDETTGQAGCAAQAARSPGTPSIRWTRDGATRLFTSVSCDGIPLVGPESLGLLSAFCRLTERPSSQATWLHPKLPAATHGPIRLELQHQLHNCGNSQSEDLLEAALTLRNLSDCPVQVEIGFASSVQPSPRVADHFVYLPLNAAGPSGDPRFASLGVAGFLKDCNHKVGTDTFHGHYLEPLASYPDERRTQALLLAPVVDVFDPQTPWRVALFTPSDQPMRFSASADQRGWRMGRCVTLAGRGSFTQRGWVMIHTGTAEAPWKAFHRFAHEPGPAAIDWVREFRVHYYDFLSSAQGEQGQRGDGYEANLAHFREFRVGMATQHGYYPCMGDHLHPDRKTWLAMKSGNKGPAEMSIERIKARIKATREAGAKAAVYMHLTALDDSSTEFYPKLNGARLIGPDGQPVKVGWNGPDVKGALWWMSLAAPEWSTHLLQQAQWIMEILQPDAIVMDETFTGLGYDENPDRRGPLGPHAIEFFKQMRRLLRSFGEDKAFFTSDCSMSGFVLWADGECGDHAYPGLLGNPLYTQEPVRYLAALGDKPWRACAWHFQHMWNLQMKLARQVSAGVGVSDGWIEYTGLARLPAAVRAKMLADITTLFTGSP
ncbi:MAG: hypothetical protein NT154_24675 [Verrucomicrobia bacterium]|nr:hypothetical protein [Verrucomicrobiota bacterium]